MSIRNVSRRNFLHAAGTLVLATTLPVRGDKPGMMPKASGEAMFQPGLFLGIDPDGTVTVTSHRSEMGQGVRTALAQIVADELEADWSMVRVAQAPGDAKYGDQNTDGSRSILLNYDRLRDAGAAARFMLRQAAADRWGVNVSEVLAENHNIRHIPTSRKIGYGDLVADAAKLEVPDTVERKRVDQHRYIGQPKVHVDADDIVRGGGMFGADIRLPNMVIATVVRCPWLGGRVLDFKRPRRAKDLIAIEVLDPPQGAPVFQPLGGLAVVTADTHTSMRIARELEIQWSDSPNRSFDSDAFREELRDAVNVPGKEVFDIGNIGSVLYSGLQEIEQTYETAFLSHAPMEPPAAIADVREGTCEVFAPVQDPQTTRNLVAGWLGLDVSRVTVNATLLGGAFGRKSKPDFVLEAVELSKRLKRPVRVQWTREDDVRHDYYHAASAQRHHAAYNRGGTPVAWLQRTAFPSITTVFSDEALEPANWELEMGFTNLPYRAPHQRMEVTGVRAGVRIGWLRSVCNIFHAFSVNVFLDEIATAAKRDAIEHRLDLLKQQPTPFDVPGMQAPPGHKMDIARLRTVVERVQKLSEWNRARPKGVGLGFAVHHSFRSYVATVIEASMENGRPKVSNAYVALDCGTYINPDTCRAQMEGAVMFGLSLALHGEINMQGGGVMESNFHDYPVLRMNEAPEVAIDLVPANGNPPAGVGEPGVPPVAPALSNALFAATGERYRSLPIKMS